MQNYRNSLISFIEFKFIGYFFLFMSVPGMSVANISLPAIFSDGMVLQQRSKVNIWGESSGTYVRVNTSWNNKTYTIKPAENGSWKIKISTPEAGGPYSITFTDGQEIKISDILIGEVWLASGQSNMEMPLKGFKDQPVAGAEEAITKSANSRIRFFNVKNISWKKPLKDCEGTWAEASPATSPAFSAVAYFYARILQEGLKVPVGIIEADWGGTIVQAWMSREALNALPDVKAPPEADEANSNKNSYAGLFNGMIHPVLGYNIKGAIWYQGEQNRNEPDLYLKMFPQMVKQWRADWGIGNFAFYYAQIAPYISRSKNLSKAALELLPKVPRLREAQLKAQDKISNSGMAVLTDIGAETTIHPPDKETVATRLFYYAMAGTYKAKQVEYSGPVYKSRKIKGHTIILNFRHTAGGLALKNSNSENFEIAGADQVFHQAKATVSGNKIILSSDKVNKPLAARYAFKAWVVGDLFNGAGLPASSFRTDAWETP